VRWIGRFAGWATLLAVPCWLLSEPYQKALGALISGVVSLIGWNVQFSEVALAAPFDLAVYAALCLASVHVSWRRRRRALALGIPLLIAGEVASAILVLGIWMMTYHNPAELEASSNFTGRLLESIPWINASALWLALLGAEELQSLGIGLARAGTTHQKAPSRGGRLRRSAESPSR
jgi:hypothetical protein